MIKCKLAWIDGNCPKDKECCCFECTEHETCSSACSETNPAKCDDAIFESSTNLEVFQSKAGTMIQAIKDIATAKKDMEEKEKQMKEQLQKAMEQYGVKSFDAGTVKMTYIEASTRNSIDSAKLKKKYPDIAAECAKKSSVKAYVKVEVK